jgi:hypothetical protein
LSADDIALQHRVKIAIITVKKDLAFSQMEDLLRCLEDEEIVKEEYQNSGISRTVLADLINEGIAPFIDQLLKQHLYNSCFVFYADTWTDKSQKHLTIAVRYWDNDRGI